MHPPISNSDLELLQQLRERQQEAKQLYSRLTPSEQEVLGLIADGHPNKAIARLIGRSIKTVEKHRSKLMKKLGISSVCELLRYWCRLRWDEFILEPRTPIHDLLPASGWILQQAARSPERRNVPCPVTASVEKCEPHPSEIFASQCR